MSAAVVCTPASPVAKSSVAMISCTGQDENTLTGYDATKYPASPAVVCHFRARKSGSDDLISPQFSASSAGTFVWQDVVFPSAGSWAVTLRNAADSQLATATITVQ